MYYFCKNIYLSLLRIIEKDRLRFLIVFLGISSFCISAFILIAEYVFHILACKLCYYQRIPYYLILCISLLYCAFYTIVTSRIKYKKLRIEKISLITVILSLLCFFSGILISIYHLLVIYGFITATCASIVKSKITNIINTDDLYNAIFNNNEVPCNFVTSEIFGLPFAFWNFLTCMFFIVFTIFIMKKYKNQTRLKF